MYSSSQAFRSSPFFATFQALLGREKITEKIFVFTDAFPNAKIGQARQIVNEDRTELISRVEMSLWPHRLVTTGARAAALSRILRWISRDTNPVFGCRRSWNATTLATGMCATLRVHSTLLATRLCVNFFCAGTVVVNVTKCTPNRTSYLFHWLLDTGGYRVWWRRARGSSTMMSASDWRLSWMTLG